MKTETLKLDEITQAAEDFYPFPEGKGSFGSSVYLQTLEKRTAFENGAIVSNQMLKDENRRLSDRVKYLEGLINEYTLKMKANLSGGKVDEFLKEQTADDIPAELFTQKETSDDQHGPL